MSDLSRTSPGTLTLGEVLRRSTEHLAQKGSETPRLDAELLLAHALGVERIELYMHLDRPLGPEELDEARALVARRAARGSRSSTCSASGASGGSRSRSTSGR